jgi:hypothetical protein
MRRLDIREVCAKLVWRRMERGGGCGGSVRKFSEFLCSHDLEEEGRRRGVRGCPETERTERQRDRERDREKEDSQLLLQFETFSMLEIFSN